MRYFVFRVDGGEDLALESKFRAYIDNSGHVFWIPSFKWSTSCSIDLSLFPLDTQICSVKFFTWLHTFENEMNYRLWSNSSSKHPPNVTEPVLTSVMDENDQWTLVDSHVCNRDGQFTLDNGMPGEFTSFSFTLALARQPLYYILNVLIPCMVVSLVSMFMFYLPIESGEKVSFGITVLLSCTILLLMVNDITPRGGQKVPILCEYLSYVNITLSDFTNSQIPSLQPIT